ncbi:MAG: hypothetical protein ACU837_01400 [Gammaproteobacteria bacterium]
MTQDDDNNHSIQTTADHAVANDNTVNGKATGGNKVKTLEKNLVHALQAEAKSVASEAVDVVKHPSHYAKFGASLAEGIAGESLGEILGGGAGTVFGPEGTVIGAEIGGMVGEVLGARQGGEAAEELLQQQGSEHSLTEDMQQEGAEKIAGRAGKKIGGAVGAALFDDVGGEIGEKLGDQIGQLAGNLAFEHAAKKHHKDKGDDAPPADQVSQTHSDEG